MDIKSALTLVPWCVDKSKWNALFKLLLLQSLDVFDWNCEKWNSQCVRDLQAEGDAECSHVVNIVELKGEREERGRGRGRRKKEDVGKGENKREGGGGGERR